MKQTAWLAFSIDRTASIPVFEQICAAVRDHITTGNLAAGAKLPPTRTFATELGVSRSTIVTAYDQLVAEGYLESAPGSGHSVCQMSVLELDPTKKAVKDRPQRATSPGLRHPVPFEAGQPDMRLFPHVQWAKTVSRICRTNPESMLVGGSILGNPLLREAIAEHLAEWRGIEASPDQIIVTAGSIDALELCIRSLSRLGDQIGLEDPGYLALRSFVSGMGLDPVYLQRDSAGSILPDPTCNARLLVLTPSHQYPLGGAISPQRRLDFVQWADRNDGWIIEDDYDSEFRFAGRPIPAMAGFDRMNRTLYIGSFSKIFSNNLRLGYLVLPTDLIETFRGTLSRFGFKASYMPQAALAAFMRNGDFYRHLRRMRRVYGERRRYLTQRLTEGFSIFGQFQDHHAGMQIAFHLNRDLADEDVARTAKQRGVAVEALSGFCGDGSAYNGLLLGYCGFSTEEVDVALTALRDILEEFSDQD